MINAIGLGLKLVDIPPFMVQGNQYMSPDFICTNRSIDLKWSSIAHLDNVVVDPGELSYQLSFPFRSSRRFVIQSSGSGFTRRFLIDEIRRSFRHLFRHSGEVAGRWEVSVGGNGENRYYVTYPFSGLYVSNVYVDIESGCLEIDVDGTPFPDDTFSLPF